MATGADGPTVAVASSRGREPFPPTWDGSEPGTEFPVFEKNVRLWEFESELESKKRGARLLRSLSGVARAVADSLEFEEIASEKGVENILSKLKGHFSPHLEVSLPRAFERAIYGIPRGHKESIQEYLIRSERAFYLLEKEKLSLPSVAVGYVIYRQASLTEGQELRFSTWSKGNYERENVVACLRKLDKVMPEHRTKGAATFLLDDAEMPEEAFDLAGDETDDGEQYIFIEEDEAEKIFEESEVQVALATYQEIRKAINANQKNRQFYGGKGRGGGRGPSWFKPGLQGKRKIHIEELKLRTRCGRCGLVGHWARECTNQPDARCKQFAAATSKSSAASAAPSAASAKTSSSMASQQSWYVSTGDAEVFDVSFCFMCGGKHTGCNNFHVHDGESLENQDEIYGVHELKGFRHFVSPPVESSCGVQKPWQLNEVWFVGLTTCPTLAVVDTAAQDGLIGSVALERLKGRLAELGLQVVQTQKQARAHGVGGAAKVLGIVAVPLGIAQTSGVLEVTVVEGEIPLLLPIKMLQQLHALIDLPRSCLHFDKLQKTVPLCKLPSGHIAIDILDFGEEGFVYPCDASEAGYGESGLSFECWPNHSTSRLCDVLAVTDSSSSSPWRICRAFRRAFNRGAIAAASSENVAMGNHNSKRAIKNWRVLLDKVGLLQQLIGLEDSVHGWLPSPGSAQKDSLHLSSEQLAEHIKTAQKLPPMKSKVRAVQEVETCGHPADRLQTGANQHAAWVNCLDCHQRWALPKQSSSKETKPQKSTAASSQQRRDSAW